MITFPNAKINLGLNIVEKRSDGYHNLETIFYPVHIEDALEVVDLKESEEEFQIYISGASVEGKAEDNLVVKAYRLLQKEYPIPPIDIYLHKHIPSGAGLGGGSSDAAFMLKLLNDTYQLNITEKQLEAYAATLGADCAFFINNKPVFATGIGNIFEPINLTLENYHIIIIKPDIFVSTREAFSLIKPMRPKTSLKEVIQKPIEEWKDLMKNDFEISVFANHPQINTIKNLLYHHGAVYASMSGSGSSVFGIFKEIPELRQIAELKNLGSLYINKG